MEHVKKKSKVGWRTLPRVGTYTTTCTKTFIMLTLFPVRPSVGKLADRNHTAQQMTLEDGVTRCHIIHMKCAYDIGLFLPESVLYEPAPPPPSSLPSLDLSEVGFPFGKHTQRGGRNRKETCQGRSQFNEYCQRNTDRSLGLSLYVVATYHEAEKQRREGGKKN